MKFKLIKVNLAKGIHQLGFAIKSHAYSTEDKTDVACYQAGSDFVNKSGPASNQLRIEAISFTRPPICSPNTQP